MLPVISQWPRALTLEPYRNLQSYQVQKIGMVGLASILLFGVQFLSPWTLVAKVTFLCSVTTLLSEALLRKNETRAVNWMNRDFDTKNLMIRCVFYLIMMPIVASLSMRFMCLPFQEVAAQIIRGNLRVVLLATLVAPIAEEVMFRGFLQERFEDLGFLVDRYIFPLSRKTKERLSTFPQALIFGALHITGSQVIKKSGKIFIFLGTSILGIGWAIDKKENRSLLGSIAIHASRNTGFVLGLRLAQFFVNCKHVLL